MSYFRLLTNRRDELSCCLCGARISEPGDRTFLQIFPGRTHAAYMQFFSHRKCIDQAMHPNFTPDLDNVEAYGTWREDRGVRLDPAPLPCCLCGAGIKWLDDRIGLEVRPNHMDDHIIFWTHRMCMGKAMHPRHARYLRESRIYGN